MSAQINASIARRQEWEEEALRWGVDHSSYADVDDLREAVLAAARVSMIRRAMLSDEV